MSVEIAVIGGALAAGAVTHWFTKAWEDQRITQPEWKTLPTVVASIVCVLAIAFGTPFLATPQAAFLAGYTIDSALKRLVNKAR